MQQNIEQHKTTVRISSASLFRRMISLFGRAKRSIVEEYFSLKTWCYLVRQENKQVARIYLFTKVP